MKCLFHKWTYEAGWLGRRENRYCIKCDKKQIKIVNINGWHWKTVRDERYEANKDKKKYYKWYKTHPREYNDIPRPKAYGVSGWD